MSNSLSTFFFFERRLDGSHFDFFSDFSRFLTYPYFIIFFLRHSFLTDTFSTNVIDDHPDCFEVSNLGIDIVIHRNEYTKMKIALSFDLIATEKKRKNSIFISPRKDVE